MATLRIVLDTNVLLSGIAYPASTPGKIMAAWRHGAIELVLSNYILNELRRVLPRLVHRHRLNDAEMEDLVDILSLQAELVEPDNTIIEELRDVSDQPVIGTLLTALSLSRAEYLITGDKDLLALADHYPIKTPAEFWAAHGGL